jgi:hypothetical protein
MTEHTKKNKSSGMKLIINMLMTIVFIIIGAALISPVQTVVSEVTTSTTTTTEQVQNIDGTTSETLVEKPTYSGSVKTMSALIPIFMVIILILFVFKGFSSFDGNEPTSAKSTMRRVFRNSKEFVLRIETSSKKYAKFVQNLDKLFKLTTLEIDKPYQPLELVHNRVEDAQGNFDELKISKEYDWFITDKHPDKYIFKVVGLHKKDEDRNVVYLLGFNNEDKATLVKISGLNMEAKVEEIVEHYSEYQWITFKDNNDVIWN